MLNFRMFFVVFVINVCVEAKTFDSYSEAKATVEKQKADYGYGVSTKIIIRNHTPDTLTLSDSDHFSGKWYTKPPASVSKILCLHDLFFTSTYYTEFQFP